MEEVLRWMPAVFTTTAAVVAWLSAEKARSRAESAGWDAGVAADAADRAAECAEVAKLEAAKARRATGDGQTQYDPQWGEKVDALLGNGPWPDPIAPPTATQITIVERCED